MADTTARVVWKDALRFTGITNSGMELDLDTSPQEDGSGGTAPTAAEIVPVALAGCTAMDVISLLKKMRQQVTGLEVAVDYERAETHPRRFTDFVITFHVTGEDLSTDRIERAISLSRDRYCSVEGTLKDTVPIHHFYTVNGGEPVAVRASSNGSVG